MARGHMTITPKADIYALGCLLVKMCTSEPLATGVLILKVFNPEADHAEPSIVHIIQRCLCVNPDGRPTAAKVQQVSQFTRHHEWFYFKCTALG